MTRSNKTIKFEGMTRYITTIGDDLSSGQEKESRRLLFLQEVCVDGIFQGLLNCGPVGFQKFAMHHDGQKWVINMEAEEFDV